MPGNSIRDLKRLVIIAISIMCVMSLALVITVVVGTVVNNHADHDRDKIRNEQDARDARIAQQQLEIRAVETCKTFNDDQAKRRDFAVQDKIKTNSIATGLTEQQIRDKYPKELAEYEAFVNTFFPDRDCRRKCVLARLDPDAADCPDLAPQVA